MTTVGMHEAKTRLSQLVQEVETGGEVVITRHGRPVARLVEITRERNSGGFGAMIGRGSVIDLSWNDVVAGDEIIADLFADSHPQ